MVFVCYTCLELLCSPAVCAEIMALMEHPAIAHYGIGYASVPIVNTSLFDLTVTVTAGDVTTLGSDAKHQAPFLAQPSSRNAVVALPPNVSPL